MSKPLKALITGGSGFIGIHLVRLLRQKGYQVGNIDIAAPLDDRNLDVWKNISLLDRDSLTNYVLSFNPDFIVHLAAKTTQDAIGLNEFEVNIAGTENLVLTSKDLKNLKKFIFASTQYVNTPGLPKSENLAELIPYGFYGESKLMGEVLIRENLQNIPWTIVRPTTIWGPWHHILSEGLWRQISDGRYFHPRQDNVVKAYGYVENTAWQIEKIISLDSKLTNYQTFYLADDNMAQKDWVEAFVVKLSNRTLRVIPRCILFLASEIGEMAKKFNIAFPLYRSRFRNLMTSNPSPIAKTHEILGTPPIRFQEGIDRTVSWLEKSGPYCSDLRSKYGD